ncbi:MAG: sigma regulatory protein MucB/RseB [Acidimicrobiales bacterium]|nr:sigma regulatory protein MucB/RseB [Acidimicrobiales bacterium]
MRLIAVALLAAAAVGGTTAAPASAALSGDSPIDQARRASQTMTFTGVVVVHWRDESGVHDTRVSVEGAGGTLVVTGGNALMAQDTVRLLRHTGSTWELLWPSAFGPSARPDPGRKYQLSTMPGGLVAGRPTTLVEVRRNGVVRERLSLDVATNLMVRRDQLDETGSVVRGVEFVELAPGAPRPRATIPAPTAKRTTSRAKASAVAGAAPASLLDGYRRIGVYTHGRVVQLLYSDGLYQLSVFEEPGRLDPTRVPAGGRPTTLAGVGGWQYSWAGGEVLLWQAGRSVYTLVGDAPTAELAEVAGSMPSTRKASLAHRLRSACRALLNGF